MERHERCPGDNGHSISIVGGVGFTAGWQTLRILPRPQDIIGQAFHFDHIIPLSAGGQTTAENLCLACSHCNIAKSNHSEGLDTETGVIARFFNPRNDDWQEHFCWSSNWKRLIGRTAIGRVTVAELKMNDKLLQEARPFWRMAGRIP